MSKLKMPERLPTDGPLTVQRDGAINYIIHVENAAGRSSLIHISPYNAWRLFGTLAMMLEIPLTPAAKKAIKF